MKKLMILGAGGHAEVCKEIARSMGKWDKIYFLDDKYPLRKVTKTDTKILGKIEDAIKFKYESDFFVAIGDNATREKILESLILNNYSIATLIDPTSRIQSNVSIEPGVVIMPNVCINTCTIIGSGSILNTGAIIEHECSVGKYVHLSPNVSLAGNVTIGNRCWLGISSTVINNLKIYSESIVGAGAVVIRDIQKKGTYVGNPLKEVGEKD